MRLAVTSLGCLLAACAAVAPSDPGDPACRDAPTWYQDVQPLIGERCRGCHAPGAIAADLPWTTYAEAQPWAARIGQAVADREMPPFIADDTAECAPRFPLMHDQRLSAAQIDLVQRWVACDAPAGDPARPAPVPDPPSQAFDADVELRIDDGYAPGRGDSWMCWALPVPGDWFPDGTDVLWLTGFEVVPGDPAVAHHIHVQIHPASMVEPVPDGERWECADTTVWGGIELGGWLPGAPPTELPAGAAIPLLRTDRIAVQVHFHGTDDDPHSGATDIRLRLGDPPAYASAILRFGNAHDRGEGLLIGPDDGKMATFRIPAGVPDHTEEMRMVVPGVFGTETAVFMASHHMHRVGTSMELWVEHHPATVAPDEPLTECVLATPRYHFDWQGYFYYDVGAGLGPKVRAGDTVHLRCTYDNTEGNAAWMDALVGEGLPAVPIDVESGWGLLDEMCTTQIGVVATAPL